MIPRKTYAKWPCLVVHYYIQLLCFFFRRKVSISIHLNRFYRKPRWSCNICIIYPEIWGCNICEIWTCGFVKIGFALVIFGEPTIPTLGLYIIDLLSTSMVKLKIGTFRETLKTKPPTNKENTTHFRNNKLGLSFNFRVFSTFKVKTLRQKSIDKSES